MFGVLIVEIKVYNTFLVRITTIIYIQEQYKEKHVLAKKFLELFHYITHYITQVTWKSIYFFMRSHFLPSLVSLCYIALSARKCVNKVFILHKLSFFPASIVVKYTWETWNLTEGPTIYCLHLVHLYLLPIKLLYIRVISLCIKIHLLLFLFKSHCSMIW